MSTQSYFICGTDTDCGKTLVSCALLHAAGQQGRTVAGHKPIASGSQSTEHGLRNSDAEQLIDHSNLALPYETVNPICLQPAIAPHIAAEQASIAVSVDQMLASSAGLFDSAAEFIVIEGAGGWLVPLNASETLADLAIALGEQRDTQAILVVGVKLGCLNHALLSVENILGRGMILAGWVANCPQHCDYQQENIDTLRARIAAPCLGIIPALSPADPRQAAQYLNLSALQTTTA